MGIVEKSPVFIDISVRGIFVRKNSDAELMSFLQIFGL